MSQSSQLPAGFEALEPFVAFWAADSAAARAHRRDTSDAAAREAFYAVAFELAPQALEYLDARSLKELDEREQRLMQLLLSFAHVSLAVELQRDDEPKHAQMRPFLRITRAPADEPAA